MLLRSGGIDIFYIDESHDKNFYVVTAICVPFLRYRDGAWQIAWPETFEGARAWRKAAKENVSIPVTKELHGVELLAGRGNYLKGKHNFKRPKAASVYRDLLRNIDFLPDSSIMSVSVSRSRSMYGWERLEAAMYALFQRMRTKCAKENVNALTFFDEGHPEYRKLYRMAQKYLPTGSKLGGWENGKSRMNLPLDMFFKDANEKNSKHCFFTQLADLVAYAAFLKCRAEQGKLLEWQSNLNAGNIYDAIPTRYININVSGRGIRDGIVRLN